MEKVKTYKALKHQYATNSQSADNNNIAALKSNERY